MILYLLLFLAEVVVLFFLSKRVQNKIGSFLFRLIKNRKVVIYLMSIIFLPGTFVHEFSHFLAALFLIVPVGNIHLIPKIEKDSVELGSVTIAKTDFVRRFFIGVAPMLLGTVVILSFMYFALTNQWYENFWLILLMSYLLFSIANTMFISKRDAQGIWGFIALTTGAAVIVILLGLHERIVFNEDLWMSEAFRNSALFLVIPIFLDALLLIILK